MADNINIIIKALLAQSGEGSLKSIEEQIKALQEKLNKEGITLNVKIDDKTVKQMENAAKNAAKGIEDAAKKAETASKDMADKTSSSMKQVTTDAEKYAKALADIKSELADLQKQRADIIRNEKKTFDTYMSVDDPIWSKLKQRSIKTPDDSRFKSLPFSVQGNYFTKDGGTEISKMAQEMGVSLDHLYEQLAKGKPKFDESTLNGNESFNMVNQQLDHIKQLELAVENAIKKQIPFENFNNRVSHSLTEEAKAAEKASEGFAKLAKVVETFDKFDNPTGLEKTFNNATQKSSEIQRFKPNESTGEMEFQGSTLINNPEKLAQAQKQFNYQMDEFIRKYKGLMSFKDIINPDDIEKIENKLNGLNLSSFKEDFKEMDVLLKQVQSGVDKTIKDQVKNQLQLHKESQQLEKEAYAENQRRNAEKLATIKSQVSNQFDLAKEALNVEKAQDRVYNKLVSVFSAGKATDEQFQKMGEAIRTSRAVEELESIDRELNKIINTYKIAQAESKKVVKGDPIGQNNLLKMNPDGITGGIKNVKDLEHFKQILKESSKELKDAEIRYVELDRATGEWTATIKQSGKENLILKGIIDQTNGEIKKRTDLSREASRTDQSMMQQFKVALERVPVWMAAMTAFYGTKRALDDMVQNILQIDKQMTELKRVMDKGTNFGQMMQMSTELAKEFGQTITDVNEAMIGFARAGSDQTQIKALTQTAIVMSNVSDLNIEQSMDNITSAMVQFNVAASDSMSIVDKLNEVDNNFAITTADLANAISRAGSTAQTFGVSLDELVGNVTAIGVATRESGEVIGNSLKTIYSRITSDDSAKALAAVGIEVKKANGENRTATEILNELGKKWEDLSATQQQNLGVVVAGRYQLSRFLALMNEYKISVSATETSLNSQGSALRENETYQASFEARINKLKASWQELSIAFGDAVINDSLIAFTNSLKFVLETMTKFTGAFSTLPIMFGTLGIVLATLYPNLRKLSGAFFEVNTGIGVTEKSLKTLTVTAGIAGKALRGIFFTSIVGAVVGLALEGLIKAVSYFTDKSNEALDASYKRIDSLQNESIELKKAQKDYEELSNKINPTIEDKKKMSQIETELVEKYGVAATGLNDQGIAYTNNTELIKLRVKALEDETRAEQERSRALLQSQGNDNIKEVEKYKSQTESIKAQLDKRKETLKQFEQDVSKGAALTNKDGKFDFMPSELNVTSDLENYKSVAQDVRFELNQEIADLNQKYQEASNKLQAPLKKVRDALKTESQLYIAELTSDGSKISDSQRLFISQMVESISTNDQNNIMDKVDTLRQAIDTINKSDFEELVKKYNDAKKAFASDNTDQNGKALIQAKDNIDAFIDTIVQKMPNATANIDALKKKMKESFSDQEAYKKVVIGFSETLPDLSEAFSNAEKELKPFNEALNTLSKGESLSADSVAGLLTKYPELIDNVHKAADGYTIEKTALEQLRQKQVERQQEMIAKEAGLTKAVIEEIKKRVQAYGLELDQITDVDDAVRKMTTEAMSRVDQNSPDVNDMIANIQNQIPLLGKNIDGYIKTKEKIDKLNEIISNPTLGVSNTKQKENKDPVEQYKVNEFESALEQLNSQIKESESLMNSYSNTSKEYRDELQHQVDLLKFKQELSSKEADRLREEDVSLQQRINALGNWNLMTDEQKKKYNELSKQLEDNQKQVAKLSSDWWDYQSQIDTKKFEEVNSNLGQMQETMQGLDDELETSRLRMGLVNENSAEYRKELELQVELLKKKQEEAHNEAEYIREQLKNNTLTLAQQKELKKRLAELSKSWFEYGNGIKQVNDQLEKQREEYADKIVDLYKDMYKKQKEIATDAIDEELDKLKNTYDEKVKLIDKEKDKYDELVDARKRSLDDQSDERKYNQDLEKKQKERQEIVNKLNVIKLDDSSQAKAQRKDLTKQLADIDLEIQNMQYDRSKELQEKNLDDLKKINDKKTEEEKDKLKTDYDKTKDNYDKMKDYIKKYYDDILNNETLFSDKKKEIMELGINKEIELYDKLRDKVVNNSKTMENAIRTSIQNALKDGQTVDKITQSKDASQLTSNISDTISGGLTSGGMPEPKPTYKYKNDTEKSMIAQMKENSRKWFDANDERKKELENANKWMGEQIGAVYKDGTWYKDELPLYHEGGVVGNGGNFLTNLANKFFNTSADESVIKALKDEVMTPSDNLSSYFKPNLQKLIASITPASPAISSGDVIYNISMAIDKLTGDKEGAKILMNELVKGVKKRGGKA